MTTLKRYYLGPDGTLCAVIEPGHCAWYWTLYTRFLHAANRVTHTVDDDQAKKEAVAAAQAALDAHLEVCPECRAVLERDEAASQAGELVELPAREPALSTN